MCFTTIATAVFLLSLTGIALVFPIYPLAAWLLSLFSGPAGEGPSGCSLPTVTMIVVVRNGAALIADKIENALSQDYPGEKLQLIIYSDGSEDGTERIASAYRGQGVTVLCSENHRGKTHGLNAAMERCSGQIAVFSDADALLAPNALQILAGRFADPRIGGVCGQRILQAENVPLKGAQRSYIRLDSWVKLLESRSGSITSNDGKLYAIRSRLFRAVAPSVTDDLYTCLSVVGQHLRFVFEPEARVYIRMPARSPGHEVRRRRRIVSRSLRGIYLNRRLLSPSRYGFFAVGLLVNKVMRRMLPLFLAALLLSSILVAPSSRIATACLLVQGAVYLLAAMFPLLGRQGIQVPCVQKGAEKAFYLCLGMYGTLLGVLDALGGRRYDRWDPRKSD